MRSRWIVPGVLWYLYRRRPASSYFSCTELTPEHCFFQLWRKKCEKVDHVLQHRLTIGTAYRSAQIAIFSNEIPWDLSYIFHWLGTFLWHTFTSKVWLGKYKMCIDIQWRLIADRFFHNRPHAFVSTGYFHVNWKRIHAERKSTKLSSWH